MLHLIGRRAGRWDDFESGSGGDGLDFVQHEQLCSMTEAIVWAQEWLGGAVVPPARAKPALTVVDDRAKIERAQTLWHEASDPAGTVVEAYLAKRGLLLPGGVGMQAIRFHPALPWRVESGELVRVPAMVAAMTDIYTNEVNGIHRTALTTDGNKLGKKMLGRSFNTAIKLDADDAVSHGLGIAEGIETALSVIARGWRPVWALGSAGAISRFPVLPGVLCLTIFGDNDENNAGLEAARSCAIRWAEALAEVTIRMPRRTGLDWNDAMRAAK